MLFYYGRIRISFSRSRGGTKQGKYCSCLVARPRLTLQGHCLPSHSCLCLLHLFGADYVMGSCLVFPDWPEWLLPGLPVCTQVTLSLTVLNQSLSLSHQEGLLGCRQSCLWSPAPARGSAASAEEGPPHSWLLLCCLRPARASQWVG